MVLKKNDITLAAKHQNITDDFKKQEKECILLEQKIKNGPNELEKGRHAMNLHGDLEFRGSGNSIF